MLSLVPRHANRSRLTSLLVALALAPAPALAQTPAEIDGARRPPPTDLPAALTLLPGPQVDEAQTLARAGRHGDAADRLYMAFQSTGDDRYLYHAALEQVAAGQHSLALRTFQQVLARRPGDEAIRVHLEEKIAAATSRTAAVRLRLLDRRTGQPLPPNVLAQIQIFARALSPTGSGRPAELTLVYDGQPLRLDPGPWSVLVRPPGYRPVELRRSPMWGAGEETWDIALVPEQVPVTFKLSPPRALRKATMRLTPTAGQAQPLERPVDRRDPTIVLSGGPWQLDIAAKRHEAHQTFVAAPGMLPVPITLTRKSRQAARNFQNHEKYLITAGALFLAQVLVGAGVSLTGSVIRQRAHDRNGTLILKSIVDDATGDADGEPALTHVESTYKTASFHHDIGRGMNLEAAGVATLFSGIALLIPVALVAERARVRWAYLSLGLGAATLGGGAAWLATTLHRRDQRLADGDPTHRVSEVELRPFLGRNVGAAMLTGLGAGLVLFSSGALIAEAAYRRRHRWGSLRAVPLAGPGFSGLTLRGSF